MTLIELLVTLAVAAILLSIGVPSFQELMRQMRATTATNTLVAAIQHTRSEAVRRGRRATLCASADGASCMASPDWSEGWLVMAGMPGEDDTEVLRVHAPETAGMSIEWRFGATASDFLSFTPTGEARTPGGALMMGSIRLCHEGEDRRVIINSTGRPRTTRQPCAD